jgi:hypothetical protein
MRGGLKPIARTAGPAGARGPLPGNPARLAIELRRRLRARPALRAPRRPRGHLGQLLGAAATVQLPPAGGVGPHRRAAVSGPKPDFPGRGGAAAAARRASGEQARHPVSAGLHALLRAGAHGRPAPAAVSAAPRGPAALGPPRRAVVTAGGSGGRAVIVSRCLGDRAVIALCRAVITP